MTDKTQPEALRLTLSIDLMDTFTDYQQEELNKAAAELRRQHARIAELEAELEAVGAGGVQALSAAPGAVSDTQHSQFLSDVLTAAGLITHGKRCKALGERLSDMVMRLRAASPTPPAEQQAAPKAAPQQKAHHLTQALTDPENQPNQYGVEFGMSGQQMHFKIGNQLFKLAYEPDEQEEFEFMKRMLVNAFSTFTPDVKAAPGEPVHGDVLPPVGSRVYIRHGRDNDAHACTVTGYYAWGDLGGDKRLHRVFVRLVYEGTDRQQARMLCDCYPTAEAALAQAAPQQEAQEPAAYIHVPHHTVEGKVHPVVSFEKYQQDYADGIYSTRIPLYTASQPAPAPLSDAQIKELIEDGVFLGNCKEIVRAIEHAHGITQKGGSNAE